METKKISELTMMEAVSGAANVLVEENGEAKRVPSYLYQPDFNQTDETAADFIRNKPFGEEDAVFFNGILHNDGGMLTLSVTGAPGVGSTATVEFDGTIYTCVAVDYGGYPALGNMGDFGGEDTGEPFLIVFMEGNSAAAFLFNDCVDVTIKIRGRATIKIPSKYFTAQTMIYCDDTYLFADLSLSTPLTKLEPFAMMQKTSLLVKTPDGGVCQALNCFLLDNGAYGCVQIKDPNINDIVSRYTAEYTLPET